MQILWSSILGLFLLSTTSWETDFEKARQSAQAEHKLILLNFSGSDWCVNCIRLEKDIFEDSNFTHYTDEHLVLVNADFPRLKKHELSKEQQKKNDQLADTYNKDGIFPLTLLLTPSGTILKKWEGYPKVSPDEFTRQLKAVVDANN